MKDAQGFLRSADTVLRDFENKRTDGDGWYHVPDSICANNQERAMIHGFEQECAKFGKHIPYEIGKQAEELFMRAKASGQRLWAHRTGLSMDDGDLSSIAKHGLMVPAQGHGTNERLELGYTATRIPQNTSGFLLLLRTAALDEYKYMKTTVLCLTDNTPNIMNGHLNPDQVVGCIARDGSGHVCNFLRREEMLECHNTKMIRNGSQMIDVDRKPIAELTSSDYCQCQINNLEHGVTLMNDSYDNDVRNCSVMYGHIVYGNLQAMAHDLNLSKEQELELRRAIEAFASNLSSNSDLHERADEHSFATSDRKTLEMTQERESDSLIAMLDAMEMPGTDAEGKEVETDLER